MSNVIKYSFKGAVDLDRLAIDMEKDNMPIVIVLRGNGERIIYISRKFRRQYKGVDLPLSLSNFDYMSGEYQRYNTSRLYGWALTADDKSSTTARVISNICTIIKSHEDATLPKTKVIGVTTTARF